MPTQYIDREEEYFLRLEMERRRKAEEEHQKKLAAEEKKKLKDLHYMRCPKCGMELSEIDYQKVKIDKCFNCDGVWLDAGELGLVTKLEASVLNKLFGIFKK